MILQFGWKLKTKAILWQVVLQFDSIYHHWYLQRVLPGRAFRQRKRTNCPWCSRVSCNRVDFKIRRDHRPELDSDTSYLFRPFPSEAVSVSVMSHQFSMLVRLSSTLSGQVNKRLGMSFKKRY